MSRHDAIVCLEGRLVVSQMGAAVDQDAMILQPVHHWMALRAEGVAPFVELLAEGNARTCNHRPEKDKGSAAKDFKCHQKGHGRHAGGKAVVAEVSVGDRPRLFMVALKSFYLRADNWCICTTIVVYREVIYPCAKVCKLHAGEDCTAGVEEYLWQWQSKHHEGYFRQTDYQQHKH